MERPNAANLELIEDSTVRSAVEDYVEYVDDWGEIRSPGKFESSPLWTVYYYAWIMEGDGESHYAPCGHEDVDDGVACDCASELAYTSFPIEADDAKVFPQLAKSIGKFAIISNESSGHVSGWISDTAEDES